MTVRVLHVFGIMNRGGAELRTLAQLEAMQQKGVSYEFCVLSGRKGVLDKQIVEAGSKVHYCKLDLWFIFSFYQLLKSQQFQVVHSHVALVSGLILAIARLAGVPVRIAHFRNTDDAQTTGLARRLRNAVLKLFLRLFATDILAVCHGALKAYWGTNWRQRNNFAVIYNGFNNQKIQTNADFWPAVIDNYEEGPVVVNVARMDYQKNHIRQLTIFLAFLRHSPSAYLVLIGKENESVKRQLLDLLAGSNAQNRVIFLAEQRDPLPFVAHADALLFPSLWEGLPGAVIEAASVGTPVVASDLPGVAEIAEQLTPVTMLSLTESDERWALTLHEAINQQYSRNDAVTRFQQSDFQLGKAIDKLYAVYSR